MKVKVLRPVIVTERFQTASWFRKIELKPGIYEMSQADKYNSNATYMHAFIPGICVQSYFPSSFGGVQIGDGNSDKEVGRSMEYCIIYDPNSFWDNSLERFDGSILIIKDEV